MEFQWRKERNRTWLLLVFVLLWAALAASMAPRPSWGADEEKKPPRRGRRRKPFGAAERDQVVVFLYRGIVGIYRVGDPASVDLFREHGGRLFFELRISMAMPPEILGRCEELLQQRDFKGIFEIVKEDDSFFSRLLTTGISELPNGLAEARESMERVGDAMTVEMEKKISMLAVLGTLGPMIGLLGTLMGMIDSFSVIARSRRANEGQRGGRRHFQSAGADVRGRGPVGAGDLLFRPVPQSRVAHFRHHGGRGGPVPAAVFPRGAGKKARRGRCVVAERVEKSITPVKPRRAPIEAWSVALTATARTETVRGFTLHSCPHR